MMFEKETLSALGAQNPWRYLRSAFWLTVSKTASIAVSLLATFYVARTLGPHNFGELSYALSIIGILAVFSAATGALYRDIVRQKDKEPVLLGTAWIVSMGTACITTALAFGYVLLIPHDRLTIMVIGILCASQFFSPFYLIQNVFYAKTETKWLSMVNFSVHVIVSFAKVAAMTLGQGVLVLAAIIVVEHILISISYTTLYVYLHHGSLLSWNFDRRYARHLIIDSLPIIIIAASGIISARIDQIFLKHYIDSATVGLYSVAVQLSEIWQFLPVLLLTAVFPALVNTRTAAVPYRRRLITLGGALILYSLTLSLILFLFAPTIISIVYGNDFAGSVPLLQLYCWSVAGIVLMILINHFLLAENFRRIQVITGILPMLINIALNVILIPIYGAAGAALATVISYSIAPVIPLIFRPVRDVLRG